MGNGHQTESAGVHLWLLLWKATRSVETFAHANIRASGLGLSDFGVLEALHHKGPQPVNALRERVLLSSGSITAAVDRLEEKGLVARAFSAEDRRARVVNLTTRGSDLIESLFEQHARELEQAFSCLDDRERATLARTLRKIGHSMNDRIASSDRDQQIAKK